MAGIQAAPGEGDAVVAALEEAIARTTPDKGALSAGRPDVRQDVLTPAGPVAGTGGAR